jgi:hypothetical protein
MLWTRASLGVALDVVSTGTDRQKVRSGSWERRRSHLVETDTVLMRVL